MHLKAIFIAFWKISESWNPAIARETHPWTWDFLMYSTVHHDALNQALKASISLPSFLQTGETWNFHKRMLQGIATPHPTPILRTHYLFCFKEAHLFWRLLMALLMAVWSFGMMPSTRITVFTFSLWFIVVLLLLVDPFAAEDFGGATPFFWFGDLSLLLRLSELWRGSELFPPRRFCRSLKGRWLEKLFFESRRLSEDSFFESRPFSRKSLLSDAVSHSSPSLEGCFWSGGFLLVVDAGALLPRPLDERPRPGVPRSKPLPLSFIPPRRNLGGGGLRSCRRLSRRLLSILHRQQQHAHQLLSRGTAVSCEQFYPQKRLIHLAFEYNSMKSFSKHTKVGAAASCTQNQSWFSDKWKSNACQQVSFLKLINQTSHLQNALSVWGHFSN